MALSTEPRAMPTLPTKTSAARRPNSSSFLPTPSMEIVVAHRRLPIVAGRSASAAASLDLRCSSSVRLYPDQETK